MWRKLAFALAPLLLLLAASGCGGPAGTTITGQVNFGKVKLAENEKLTLSISDGGKTFSSEVDSGGKFSFADVTPGKYIVTLTFYKSATGKSGPGRPEMRTYPDDWTVPGGPYAIDLDKMPPQAVKK